MPRETDPLTLTPGAHAVIAHLGFAPCGVYRARYDDVADGIGAASVPGRKSQFRGFYGGMLTAEGQPYPEIDTSRTASLWRGHWYDSAEEALQEAEGVSRFIRGVS